MTQAWEKLGKVFGPAGEADWLQSHASLPLPWRLEDRRYRVYFASRDARNRSHVGFVEIDLGAPHEVLERSSQPALAPGPLGHFDHYGVYPASLAQWGDELWLYYIGWSPGVEPPLFTAAIGLAISRDGGLTFERTSPAPLLARGEHDPCLVTSPCVIPDGDGWTMHYVSGRRWDRIDGKPASYYDIKRATSPDGRAWRRDGVVSIPLGPGERNLARPCVVPGPGGYRMWYSRASGQGYRPGYAESGDGLHWTRRDEAVGIEVSADGWDSDAIAYPWVVVEGDHEFMFYNGNGYGRDGFGLAVRDAK